MIKYSKLSTLQVQSAIKGAVKVACVFPLSTTVFAPRDSTRRTVNANRVRREREKRGENERREERVKGKTRGNRREWRRLRLR